MTKFGILHFSDLHFGEYNIEEKGKYKFTFDNFFNLFIDFLDGLLTNNGCPTKLVIISGDFFTKGIPAKSKYFYDFFKFFSNRDIPIITCLGNHDIVRQNIDIMTQFKQYSDLINSIRNLLGIDKLNGEYLYKTSSKFEENQASYVYIKQFNSIFFALNSCKNIEEKKILKENGLVIFDKEYLNIGLLKVLDINYILNEIRNEVGNDIYNKSFKFLICHHTLVKNGVVLPILNQLKKKGVKIIFSGHEHNYQCLRDPFDLDIINYCAGSPFLTPEVRINFIDFSSKPLQFNQYIIDIDSESIKPFLYSFDMEWIEEKKPIKVGLSFTEEEITKNILYWLNKVFKFSPQIYDEFKGIFNIDLKVLEEQLKVIGIGSLYKIKKIHKSKITINLWLKEIKLMLIGIGIFNKILNSGIDSSLIEIYKEKLINLTMFFGKDLIE